MNKGLISEEATLEREMNPSDKYNTRCCRAIKEEPLGCLVYLQNASLCRCQPMGLEESIGVSQVEEGKESHVLTGGSLQLMSRFFRQLCILSKDIRV